MAASVRLGLLVPVDEPTDGHDRFTARLAKWASWEPADTGGAERQRRSRAKSKAEAQSAAGREIEPCH